MIVLVPKLSIGSPASEDEIAMRMVSKLICHQIYLCQIERAKNHWKGKPKRSEVFGPFRNVSKVLWLEWFGWNYKKTLDNLIYKKIIECNSKYSSGRFSKSYRLAENLWDEKLVLHEINFYSPTVSHIDSNLEQYEGPHKEEYLCAESHLKRFVLPDWNVDKLNKICNEIDQESKKWSDYQRFCIASIHSNNWWSKADINNRYHTPLTTLSSKVRKHIIHDHHTAVGGWDFKNFQPSLLKYYRETGLSQPIPQDEATQYFRLCKSGNIYEFFAEKMGLRSRDDVKKPMLTMLNIDNERMVDMKVFHCLAQWFPVLASIIFAIKQDDHTRMSTFLQRKESEIIFGHIVKSFRPHNQPFFTVHDSVITTKKNIELLGNIFREVIGGLGIETREDKV